jgi:hypothetical protein
MKTVDLAQENRTIGELLELAESEPVLIHSAEGRGFLLEQADEFEREVVALGGSEKFMSFLSGRSQEDASIPASEVATRLGIAADQKQGVEQGD